MLCLFSYAGSHHTARQTGWFKVPRPQRETTIQIRSPEEGESYWTQYTIIQSYSTVQLRVTLSCVRPASCVILTCELCRRCFLVFVTLHLNHQI